MELPIVLELSSRERELKHRAMERIEAEVNHLIISLRRSGEEDEWPSADRQAAREGQL